MPTLVWKALAVFFILIGAVGVVLPVLPTVPFLLLAAAAASKGWPWLDDKLLSHPDYGPIIRRWRERRSVPRRAKWFATLGMSGSAVILCFTPVHPWLRIGLIGCMVAVGAWLWRRPED